ncbi:hypothetical protein BGZ61DRAFT_443872 [Ilyonectria robusta]|uniref:uncharacterized protein n=1 Tax=Ilyonectria robusta TaxID=1079257 RepID=UPI001E8CEDAE|nr:uncharacterized protein BGZ61DRAFT_443872 [Ilyonectria robusta]KAH8735184.1 hypothetical protein BGZ61DRAFT_443872 [Ilyonectria robusta]
MASLACFFGVLLGFQMTRGDTPSQPPTHALMKQNEKKTKENDSGTVATPVPRPIHQFQVVYPLQKRCCSTPGGLTCRSCGRMLACWSLLGGWGKRNEHVCHIGPQTVSLTIKAVETLDYLSAGPANTCGRSHGGGIAFWTQVWVGIYLIPTDGHSPTFSRCSTEHTR